MGQGLTITRRIVAPLILLILIGNLIVVAFAFQALNQQIARTESYRLTDDLNIHANQLSSSVGELQRDLQVLAASPTIWRYDPNADDATKPGALHPQQRADARTVLLALIAAKPQYAVVRMLDAAGQERLRIERDEQTGAPEVCPDSALQSAADQPIFQAAKALPKGEVHLSRISQSARRHDGSSPSVPLIQAAVALRNADDSVRAVVIISQDLSPLFASLAKLAQQRGLIRLANADGDYLFHEDPDAAFAFLRNQRRNLRDDFPQAEALWQGANGAALTGRDPATRQPYAMRTIQYAGRAEDHRLILIGGGEDTRSRDIRGALLYKISAALLLGTLLSALIAWAIARHITRPIVQMHRALTAKGHDVSSDDLPLDAEGEVGTLANAFNTMLADLRRNQAALAAEALRAEQARKQVEDSFGRLQMLNQEVEQFAYIASHDLKEPLRTINSFANLLSESYGSALDAEGQEMLTFLQDAPQRMEKLINGLLNYSKLGKNSQFVETSLEALLQEVCADIGARIRETGAQIHYADLPTIFAMQTELRLLFQNLLANAIKFAAPDRRPEIRITAEAIDGGWQFSVCDNGIGIAEEHLSRIFMIFERIKSKVEGSGIGLAHCKKIVEMHGGMIWVESTPGTGSCFHFTLMDPLFT